jgi:hypothetical protein
MKFRFKVIKGESHHFIEDYCDGAHGAFTRAMELIQFGSSVDRVDIYKSDKLFATIYK